MKTRNTLALVVVASLLVVLAGRGQAQNPAPLKTVTLRMNWTPSGTHALFVAALDKGWYRERGLDVKILDGRGSVATVQTVGAGHDTFGHASYSSLIIARGDLPVKAIATTYQKNDIGIIVPVDSPIKSLKDLTGKTMFYSAGGFEVPLLPILFKRNGVAADSVKLVNIPGAAKYTQYTAGGGDAMAASAPASLGISAVKRPSRVFHFSDHGVPMAGQGLFTTDRVIASQPEVVRAFVEASLRGIRWATAHPKEAAALLKKHYPDIDETQSYRTLLRFNDYLLTDATKDKPLGTFVEAEWKPILDTMVEAGIIRDARPVGDYYTNEFLPAQ